MTTFRLMMLFILLLTPTAATGAQTALHEAAGKGHADVVTVLLEHGADAEATNWAGRTPRDITTHRGIIRLLD